MKFNFKLFLYLTLGFILATVIGTLSHELGHYLIAKSKGFNAQIHYGYTSWSNGNVFDNPNHIKDILWIALGGPISTLLTSILGLSLLAFNYSSIKKSAALSFIHWINIFLALFSLRFVANLFIWIAGINRDVSTLMDEVRIAMYLGWPSWILMIVTFCLGLVILAWVFLKCIPSKHRGTFLLGGMVGGVSGFIIWMKLLGPILLP